MNDKGRTGPGGKDWRGGETRGGRGGVTRREDDERRRENVIREMLWEEKETRREILIRDDEYKTARKI